MKLRFNYRAFLVTGPWSPVTIFLILVHINDVFETHYAAWSDIYEYGPGTEGIPTEEEDEEDSDR